MPERIGGSLRCHTITKLINHHGVILPLCVAKHIEFRAELSNIRRAILVDKLKYNQIFFNLLSNAVKFTPAGGHICISESHQEIGNRILLKIVVQDDGIGIPAEFQKRLFSPFAQAQQPDMTENQGSGLGLAITHRLVRLMFRRPVSWRIYATMKQPA